MEDLSFYIFMEVFVTIHSSVFVLFPLAKIFNKKNPIFLFLFFFFLRVILLSIGDAINPQITAFSDFFGVFFGAFIVVPVFSGVQMFIKKSKVDIDEPDEVDISELSSIGISDPVLITNRLVNQFIKVRTAFASLDYKTVSKFCTPLGYKKYKDQMLSHNEHGEKVYFQDVQVEKSRIAEAYQTDKYIYLEIVTLMSMINYTMDSYGKIISGSDTKRRSVSYSLIFKKYLEEDNDIKECPNCGAPLTNMHKCSYCNTTINFHVGEWLLNSEIIMKERR